jgi:hypothetical protein
VNPTRASEDPVGADGAEICVADHGQSGCPPVRASVAARASRCPPSLSGSIWHVAPLPKAIPAAPLAATGALHPEDEVSALVEREAAEAGGVALVPERVGEAKPPVHLGGLECGHVVVSDERLRGAANDPTEDRRQFLAARRRDRDEMLRAGALHVEYPSGTRE